MNFFYTFSHIWYIVKIYICILSGIGSPKAAGCVAGSLRSNLKFGSFGLRTVVNFFIYCQTPFPGIAVWYTTTNSIPRPFKFTNFSTCSAHFLTFEDGTKMRVHPSSDRHWWSSDDGWHGESRKKVWFVGQTTSCRAFGI